MRCERCDDPRTCGGCEDVCDPDACCGDPWGCERERCPSDDALDRTVEADGRVA